MSRKTPPVWPLMVAFAALSVAPNATAQQPNATAEQTSALYGPTYPVGEQLRLLTLPGSELYPRYLADPRQPMMKALVLKVLKNDTPETGSPLLEFTMGGTYGLLRLHPKGQPELGLQLNIHTAFIGQFDPEAHYDAIGWDGYYGARLTYRPLQSLGFKLGYQHDSAHIADEYMRKTDRRRLNYTREEVALGVMVDPLEFLRLYTEFGYAFHVGSPELKTWRPQAGVELRWNILYAAADVNLWEERDWRPTTTAQLGVMFERAGIGRRYGMALQFENGRSKLGEFFLDQSRTIGAGWWVDL